MENKTISYTKKNNYVRDKTQDPGSIFYLHASESASTKLVFVVFDGTSYIDWKRSMTIGLNAKNKMSFVDGSLPQPLDGDDDEKAWKRCNNMVIVWIISSLDKYIAKSIMYLKTASDIWNDLEGRFGTPSSSHMYRLQERLLNTYQEPGMTIAEYFTKVKSLWDEIDDLRPLPSCSCHPTINFVKIQQDQRLMTFLMKLDPQYNQVRTNLLIKKDMPEISEVYRELNKELNKEPIITEVGAFGVERRRQHERRTGRNQNNGKRPTYYCEHCKIEGHSIERCFNIHGYPNKNKPNSSKKIASIAHAEDNKDDSNRGNSNRENQFGLSEEQFTCLLSFLGKKDTHNLEQHENDSSSNLAGCLSSSGVINKEMFTPW